MSYCPFCEKDYPNRAIPKHFGSDPQCGFPDGVFTADNWQCGTLNRLRHLANQTAVFSWDENAALIPVELEREFVGEDGESELENIYHLLITWYKQRGATDGAWYLPASGAGPQPLTLKLALTALADEGITP